MGVKVDPRKDLVFVGSRRVPFGYVGPWGFGDTQYLRKMGSKQALLILGHREGLFREVESGFADARTGALVTESNVDTYTKRDGERPGMEELFGPREFSSDHPIVTRHGGLMPESIRRNLATYLGGFSQKRPDERMIGNGPMSMQIQVLSASLYFAGLGKTLPEITEPERCAIFSSSGLPGAEKFVEAARMTGFKVEDDILNCVRVIKDAGQTYLQLLKVQCQSNEAAAKVFKDTVEVLEKSLEGIEDFLKNGVVGRDKILARKGVIGDTLRVAYILASGTAGGIANLIGPREKGRALAASFHHSGECATLMGTIRAAALTLRADPDEFQVPDIIFFGSAEAAFANAVARLISYLFNSMRAMEPTDNVLGRGTFWDALAPFTDDVFGFWPGEGSGFGGLTTGEFAMRKRLRILARLVSVGASADQGGLNHPANLGAGCVKGLEHALRVAMRKGVIPTYVNAHGPGTNENNEEEPKSLVEVMNTLGIEHMNLYANKGVDTHTLADAGAAALCGILHAAVNGVFPGALNLAGRTVSRHVDPSRLTLASGPVRGVKADLRRSQGFWFNYEEQVDEVVAEGDLERIYEGVTSTDEMAYWSDVRESDFKGAEAYEKLLSGGLTHKANLEGVRFG